MLRATTGLLVAVAATAMLGDVNAAPVSNINTDNSSASSISSKEPTPAGSATSTDTSSPSSSASETVEPTTIISAGLFPTGTTISSPDTPFPFSGTDSTIVPPLPASTISSIPGVVPNPSASLLPGAAFSVVATPGLFPSMVPGIAGQATVPFGAPAAIGSPGAVTNNFVSTGSDSTADNLEAIISAVASAATQPQRHNSHDNSDDQSEPPVIVIVNVFNEGSNVAQQQQPLFPGATGTQFGGVASGGASQVKPFFPGAGATGPQFGGVSDGADQLNPFFPGATGPQFGSVSGGADQINPFFPGATGPQFGGVSGGADQITPFFPGATGPQFGGVGGEAGQQQPFMPTAGTLPTLSGAFPGAAALSGSSGPDQQQGGPFSTYVTVDALGTTVTTTVGIAAATPVSMTTGARADPATTLVWAGTVLGAMPTPVPTTTSTASVGTDSSAAAASPTTATSTSTASSTGEPSSSATTADKNSKKN